MLVRALLDPSNWSGKLLFDESERYTWVVSAEIVTEYLRVLERPKLVEKYRAVANRDLETIVAQIATAMWVHLERIPRVSRDPTDGKFLAAALAGNAEFIVSEDDDLLELGSYEGIAILPARAFLAVLEQRAN